MEGLEGIQDELQVSSFGDGWWGTNLYPKKVAHQPIHFIASATQKTQSAKGILAPTWGGRADFRKHPVVTNKYSISTPSLLLTEWLVTEALKCECIPRLDERSASKTQ